MNQLWETSLVGADCDRGVNDEPFFMPLTRRDLIQLRLIVPYHFVTLNGGGIPTGSGVALSIYNVTGTTLLCDYSTANIGNFLYSYRNDGTNRVAEYQFLFALGLADESAEQYSQYVFDVVANDVVMFDTGTTVYYFTYGIDDLPTGFIEYKSGSITVGLTDTEFTNYTLEINGVADTVHELATTPSCAHEDLACFRFKVSLNFATLGQTLEYFTKPFRVIRCDDEPTILMQATYPAALIDCGGHIHEGAGGDQYKNRHYLRIPGEVEVQSPKITKSYNNRSHNFKSQVQETFLLKSEPMPKWFADGIKTVIASQEVRIDGIEYLQEDIDLIFEKNDFQGSNYMNLNLPLQYRKCEKVFVCQ